jgi:cystathionine beta-lyase
MSDSPSPFDIRIDRRSTGSMKWGRYAARPSVLPMWVADMEFQAPPPVLEALRRHVDHGVLGYDAPTRELDGAVVRWLASRHGWEVDPSWLVWMPGVMPGVSACCAIAGEAGDPVGTVTPIYPPFLVAPTGRDRRIVRMPLTRTATSWEIDFGRLEAEPMKVLLLCSPHNPTGRVWTRAELERIAAVCREKNVLICSDDIWCDLVLDPGCRHVPIASLDPGTADRTVTLMAPSKTFNLAGLYCAFAVVPNARLRRAFEAALASWVRPNTLGLTAALAAYREGEPWLGELIPYLLANRDRVRDAVGRIPRLSMVPGEATYLAWIDARGMGVPDPQRRFEAAGLALFDGVPFDAPGWLRLNFGCPRGMVDDAMQIMARVPGS